MDSHLTGGISIIVPTYNRYNVLVRLVQHLLSMDHPPFEIIIVDQSDVRENAHCSQLTELVRKYDTVRWIIREKPSPSAARNVGILEAKFDTLLFLDDDVLPLDGDFFQAHLEGYSDRCVAAVCGPILKKRDEDLNANLPEEELPSRLRRIPGSWLFGGLGWQYGHKRHRIIFPTCNGSVRRKVALEIGGFDENLLLCDDHDFAARLDKAGYLCLWEPRARVVDLSAPTGGTRSPHMLAHRWPRWSDRRRIPVLYFWVKNYPNRYVLTRIVLPHFMRRCFNRHTLLNPVLFIYSLFMNMVFLLWIFFGKRNLIRS